MFVLFFFLLLNLFVGYIDANQVGRYWTEKSQLPAWPRFLLWCGAIMSASAFFVVYVSIITMIMHDLHWFEWLSLAIFDVEMTAETADLMAEQVFNLAYLMVIFPVLGTGLAIWANSIAVAFMQRDWLSAGVAGYNTWAMARNTINAVRYVPRATKDLGAGLGKLFSNKSMRQLVAYAVIFLFPIVISLGGAIATTAIIIKASDEKFQLEDVART